MMSTKLRDVLTGKTVGQLVVEDYRRAEVFKKYGIDFCCGGNRPLEEACQEKGIDPEQLFRELERLETLPSDASQPDFNEWELDFLADYIVNVHHGYLRKNFPQIQEYADKVAHVHGDAHRETVEIARLFAEIIVELRQHMLKEENILFPYIKQLVSARNSGSVPEPPPFGSVQNPIHMMEMEHDHAGDILKRIRKLSRDFTLPEDACNTFRVTYAKLAEFEADLLQHIHLENNILFPKAVALEAQLLKR